MTDLQTIFYIVAIVYMCLMFLITVGVLIAALVIKSKITKLQRKVDAKVATVKSVSNKALKAFYVVRYFAKR
jgi:hypothetical protein